MSVFRQRYVFRDSLATALLGGLSLITAEGTGTISLTGTGSGSTPATTGTGSGTITLTAEPVTSITLEVYGTGLLSLTGTATGISVSPVTGTGTITLTGSGAQSLAGTGNIVLSGAGTVGTIFTMDGTGSISLTGTAAPQTGAVASATIALTGIAGTPEVTGGTVTPTGAASITLSGTGEGTYGATNNVPDQFYFETIYNAELNTVYVSSVAVIKGISVPSLSVVANGEQSVNGGAFTEANVFVEVDDELRLRHPSDTEPSTQKLTTAIIGGVTGRFVSITAAATAVRAPWRHRFHKPRRRT